MEVQVRQMVNIGEWLLPTGDMKGGQPELLTWQGIYGCR